MKLRANKDNPAYRQVIPQEIQQYDTDNTSEDNSSEEENKQSDTNYRISRTTRQSLPKPFAIRMQEDINRSGIDLGHIAPNTPLPIGPWELSDTHRSRIIQI